jgi:hypothetical protein
MSDSGKRPPRHSDKGPTRHDFKMPSTGEVVPVYAGKKLGRALDELQHDFTFYEGVRMAQVIEAVYKQGLKDGAGARPPGRPPLSSGEELDEDE